MYKKKSLFITFEGIEGSGKSFQSKKLYNNLKLKNISSLLTREPGGTGSAEKIRNVILDDYFHPKLKEKFNKYTDTLLYLASRNEHVINKIKPAILMKKIVICDRFIDSTMAYQVYGKNVNRNFIDHIHKHILKGLKPDITFLLRVNVSKALFRLKKRKRKIDMINFQKVFIQKFKMHSLKYLEKIKDDI